jgi:hypothetical protein
MLSILLAFIFLQACDGVRFKLSRLDANIRSTWRRVLICNFALCLLGNEFAEFAAASPAPQVTYYKSGKSPFVQNPNDLKEGTKKDKQFLRSMSNCKAKCQAPSEGLAKVDCIQDCQDQCCSSYEQCSLKIKINTGNSI